VAIYERDWKPYSGPLSPPRDRALVLPRYALRDAFGSRFFFLFFLLCYLPPLCAAILIYLRHNLTALTALSINPNELVSINNKFFWFLMGFQNFLAFLVAMTVGPALVSADLANNALPLYLSRPLTRAGYLLGKFLPLALLLSAITWMPGLLLVLLQTSVEGLSWLRDNLRIPVAILLSSGIWIVVLSLMMLAVSAWVKRKSFARIAVIAYFFTIGAFGGAINLTLGTNLGSMLNLSDAMTVTALDLFGVTGVQVGAVRENLPLPLALLSLAAIAGLCVLALTRKIRAYEVVR